MELKLKTNRLGIIKFLLPIYILFSLVFLLMLIVFTTHYEDVKDDTVMFIIICCAEMIFTIGIILTALIRKKTYICTENNIAVYSHNKLIKQFDIDYILRIQYRRFRWRYILTTFSGELMDGGCWKVYLYLSNGNKIVLDIFELKDVKKLKNLYGNLVQILG